VELVRGGAHAGSFPGQSAGSPGNWLDAAREAYQKGIAQANPEAKSPAVLGRQLVFVAPHFDLILMLAGLREIVGRLQAQPVVGVRPTGLL
jgi:hypothetical protein